MATLAAPSSTLPASELLSTLWTFSNSYGGLDQPLIVAGDRIVGSSQGTVFLLDIYQGREVVTTDVAGVQNFPYTMTSMFGSDPHFTAVGGNLYFMDGNTLVALRLADGAPVDGWTPPTLGQVSALFAADGRVVVCGLDANGVVTVSAYDTLTGKAVFGPVKPAGVTQSPGAAATATTGSFSRRTTTVRRSSRR